MRFYFTFGFGSTLWKNYVVVEAPNEEAAREKFLAAREAVDGVRSRWAFVYTADAFDHQPDMYGLTEVPIDTPNQLKGRA